MDALQQIQNKILKLEEKLKDARDQRKHWANRYQEAQKKIEKLESEIANQSELEHLRVENGKLRVQVNQLQRNERAVEKIKKIERILKG